ncbi:MAG: hypothetical protein OXC44_04890 [Proteobacteria bacterium]|nr:hypothetical protein [Pseudomonadota bacterium]
MMKEVRCLYDGDQQSDYLCDDSKKILNQARQKYRACDLHEDSLNIHLHSESCLISHWYGDEKNTSLWLALKAKGWSVKRHHGLLMVELDFSKIFLSTKNKRPLFSYCSPYGFLLDSRLKREAPMKMIKEWVLGEASTKNNQLHTLIKDVYKMALLPLLIDLNALSKGTDDLLKEMQRFMGSFTQKKFHHYLTKELIFEDIKSSQIDLNSVPKIAADILARSAKSSLINR